MTESVKFWVFTIAVAIILMGMLTYIFVSSQISKTVLFNMSMITSGGISNFIDRLVNDGEVVDFMNVGICGLRTGIFNFADVAITIGVVMLLLFHVKHSEMSSNKAN